MKRSTIFILVLTAIILGILSGILINALDDNKLEQAQINEIKKVNELMDDKFANQNSITNDIVLTNGADIKLSPNAIICFQKHYKECGHTIVTKEQIASSEVNKDEEYFKSAYSDWNIESFDSDVVKLYKEMEGICGKHYLITTKDEYIAIYIIENDGNKKLKEVTDIPVRYLPNDDIELLERGITANGDNELIKKLEDFE